MCESLVALIEDDVAEEQEVQIEEDETEVMAPKEAPDPGKPTARQVALHRLTHLPFRLWCKWCVLGRGRGMQHRRLLGGLLIPILGLDYFVLTKGGAIFMKSGCLQESLDGLIAGL